MNEIKLIDERGQRIDVGSIIVWPGRKSSSVWMSTGEVLSMKIRTEGDTQTIVGLKVRSEFTDRIVHLGPVGVRRALRIA